MAYKQDEDTQVEWNIDDAFLQAVFEAKIQFDIQLREWDLENAYWTLILLDSEVSPALKEDNQNTIKDEMKKINDARKKHFDSPTQENKRDFHWKLLNIYKKFNSFMINEGWYSRKKDYYRGL